MGLRAFLFDYDGTLNDSREANYEAFTAVIRELQDEEITLQEFVEVYRPDWYESYRKMGIDEERWPEADELWMKSYRPEATSLFPKAAETLKSLRGMDYKTGLVTGGSRGRIEKELFRRGIRDLFDVRVYGDDFGREQQKPEARQIEHALEMLGLPPKECAYVGDTTFDVQAARDADVLSIAIDSGFHPPERLRQSRPDHTVHALDEVLDIASKLGGRA